MKKFMNFILVLSFLFVIAACDNGREDEPVKDDIEYTVSFKGNHFDHFNEKVLEGKKIVKPTNPEKDGYTFIGWYLEVDEEKVFWDFDVDVVDKDLVLNAEWEKIPDEPKELTDAEKLAEDLSKIGELDITANQVNLPGRGSVHNTLITWTTSNPFVVTKDGYVARPPKNKEAETVTLTATARIGRERLEKDFEVTIEPKGEPVVTEEKELPFKNLTNEYEVENINLMTYFVDGGALPYVDVEAFYMLLNGHLHSDELEFSAEGDVLSIDYVVTDEQNEKSYDFNLEIDFFLDTLYTESISFFSAYIKSTATDYSEGLTYLDTYSEEGDAVTFNLADYRVDLIIHEEGDEKVYLMPFSFANMIFISESYYNVYYNGDGFYGIYAIPSANDRNDEYKAYETIKNSSLNGTAVSFDVALAAFDQLAFAFDHYFGLRYETAYYEYEESFYELLAPYLEGFLKNRSSLNEALFDFVTKTVDESHTSAAFPGFYNRTDFSYGLSILDLGPRVSSWYHDGVFVMQDALDAAWGQLSAPDYRFLDEEKESAVIYLSGFLTATVDETPSKKNDSNVFMRETLADIFAENPNVKNIGIDISYNTGGNIGALFRVLGYITDEPIQSHYQNPLDNSRVSYFIDVDTEAVDVNWFLVSSKVSFSAANLFASIFKQQNLGPIFGTTTGGGACSITPIVLADGSMIIISSNSVLSYREEAGDDAFNYYSVEQGIEPDLELLPRDTQKDDFILDLLQEYYAS